MKSSFKYIVVTIITSLVLVFIFQLYWLTNLYGTIKTENEKKLLECISEASVEELQFRIDSSDSGSNNEQSISISLSMFDDDEKKEDKGTVRKKHVMNKQDTVYSVEHKDESEAKLKDLERIIPLLRDAMHQAIDPKHPVQLDTLQSFINENIKQAYITTSVYGIEAIDLTSNKILHSNLDSTLIADNDPYDFVYDSESNLAYRVYIEPLTKNILNQMSGILITTVLIALILSFAFWYLLKTIMKLKTLEQMKDDFTNNMTHELKTPIAVAYSATDALLTFGHGENKERREKYLTICKEQLSELTERVEQILSMSVEGNQSLVLKKEQISVSDMINNLVTQFKLKYGNEKDILFDISVEPTDIQILADRMHLNNILSNLIDNSIKYSNKALEISVSVYSNEKMTVIEIKDNSIGIAPHKLPYIFDKFYRVTDGNKYTTKGYGLGLFYVKTMVDKHQGTISVKSTVNKGTSFKIQLPR